MNNGQLPAAPLHNDELVKAFMEVEQVAPNGLTKREYIATIALQGMVSYCAYDEQVASKCKTAVEYADTLLKELAK